MEYDYNDPNVTGSAYFGVILFAVVFIVLLSLI